MTTLRAHFDGKVLVPNEPVDLPVGQELEVQVTSVEAGAAGSVLRRLAKLSGSVPAHPDVPTDGAAQHDHYLYGSPKQS